MSDAIVTRFLQAAAKLTPEIFRGSYEIVLPTSWYRALKHSKAHE